eukprot:m.202584 g.202584  ORF g.202584 m.202584 type:complete len:78 (+) comp53838_c0_seq22:59-292(+)
MSLARTSETSEAAKSTSTSASSQIFTSVTSLRAKEPSERASRSLEGESPTAVKDIQSVRFNTCSELAVMRKQGWLGS